VNGMDIYSLSYKNLHRNKWRNISTVLRISFGVLVLTILLSSGLGINSALKQVQNVTGDVFSDSQDQSKTGIAGLLSSTKDYINSVLGTSFTNSEFVGGIKNILMNLVYFLDFIASIILLVGLLGILNTMNINLLERRREIALLKVMGFTENQIIFSTILEAGLLGLIGGLIGTTVGVLGIVFVSGIIKFNQIFILVPWWLPVMVLALTTVLSMVIALYPAFYECKKDILPALRYE
jgi:putative ABC transport system permease protein